MGIFTGNKNHKEKEVFKFKVKYNVNGVKGTSIVWAENKGEAMAQVEGAYHAGK